MSNKNDGTVIQQHYLPQNSYLKHFTDGNGHLHTYRFDQSKQDFYNTAHYFTPNPSSLAKEGYIYEAPHMPKNALEQTLANIESVYIGVLESKVLDRKELTDEDEEKIALFIEVLHARVPAYRSHVNGFLDELDAKGRMVAMAHDAPDAADRFSDKIASTKKGAFADSVLTSMMVNMWQHADVCILYIDPIFKGMTFITSDNPVSVLDYAKANSIYGIAPLSKTIEVVAPITAQMAVFINNIGLRGYRPVDANFVREINHRVLRGANDFILSQAPVDKRIYDAIVERFPQSLLLKLMELPKGKADHRLAQIKAREQQEKK